MYYHLYIYIYIVSYIYIYIYIMCISRPLAFQVALKEPFASVDLEAKRLPKLGPQDDQRGQNGV